MLSKDSQTRFSAALIHLAASALVVALIAIIIVHAWFPPPYFKIGGGWQLFSILLFVDITIGPVLTGITFSSRKSIRERTLDTSFIVAIQISALAYGIYAMAMARPVWLAFERDHFQVVTYADIDQSRLSSAPIILQHLSWSGPRLLGVNVASPGDRDFLFNVQQSLQGSPPSFRPDRWTDFNTQRALVKKATRSIEILLKKQPELDIYLNKYTSKGNNPRYIPSGYIPVISKGNGNWIAIIDKSNGEPIDILPIDGW